LPDSPPPLQFSLRRLFQLTAVCAVLMALIVAWLPLGLMATFGVAGFFLVWLANQLDAVRGDEPLAVMLPLTLGWLGMFSIGLTSTPLLTEQLGLLPGLMFGGPGAFGACFASALVESESKLGAAALASHICFATLLAPACRFQAPWLAAAVAYLVLSSLSTLILMTWLMSLAAV
jgi:hypothetical protein